MKNIGIFTHDLYPFKPWGQGRYVHDLVKNLRLLSKRKIFVFSPTESVADDFHITIFPGSHSSFGKNISFSIKLNFIIERLIKKYNLGLCHFQGGPGGLFLLKKLTVPVFYTVHHTFFQQSSFIQSQRWKKLFFFLENYSYHLSDALLSVSPSTHKYLVDQYGLDRSKCRVIPAGVEIATFYPVVQKAVDNSILFLGRLEKRKGIDLLIKAIPVVKQKIPKVQLFVVGKGRLERQLRRYVNFEGLNDNVRFLGTIDECEVVRWYSRVSIVVIPSIFEGFGLTAVEAMACGTPVIATAVDGLKDIIENNVNGKLVASNDIEILSCSIIDLLTDTSLCEKLANNGLEMVGRKYNWDSIARQILAEYQEQIEQQLI